MRRWIIGLLGALALSSPVTAQINGDPEKGAVIFATKGCQGCHGVGAVGGMGPALLGPNWKYGGDPASIAKGVREGHLPLMPPMAGVLSEAQIDDVVAYVKMRGETLSPVERALVTARAPTGVPKGVVRSAVHDFRVEQVANVGAPYAMAFLPDNRILISEAAGPLRVVQNGKLLPQAVRGAPAGDITGMTQALRRANLSVAVGPNYKTDGWIYLMTARVAAEPQGKTAKPREGLFPGTTHVRIIGTIVRGRLKGMDWVDTQKVLEFPIQKTNSLRMKFDAQGLLYIGTTYSDPDFPGDGEGKGAQDLASLDGKILRMNGDGSAPADNPFVGRADANPLVWSYGHREPSGLTFDAKGRLWEVEDGPRGGDELNHILKGRNYGWPVVTWGHRYDTRAVPSNPEQDGTEQPVVSWVPSPAVSDVEWYGGSAFPRWKDSLFVGTMKNRDLLRVTVDGDRATLVETVLHNVDRIRDIDTGSDGLLYILTDNGDLLRLVPVKP